jgi:hypothetical protein
MSPETQEFLFQHFQETYKFQLERIDKLRDRISFVVAILTVLGSALLFLLSNYPYHWRDGWSLFFYVPAGAALLVFFWSTLLVLWVIGKHTEYQFIPSNPEVQDFADRGVAWGEETNAIPQNVLLQIKKQLLEGYRDAAFFNFGVNRKKTDRLIFAQRLAVIAFLVMFVCAPRYYFDKLRDEEKPTKVLLVASPKKGSVMSQTPDANSTPAAATPAAATPAAATPAVPPFPKLAANTFLSEGAMRMEDRPVPPPDPPTSK